MSLPPPLPPFEDSTVPTVIATSPPSSASVSTPPRGLCTCACAGPPPGASPVPRRAGTTGTRGHGSGARRADPGRNATAAPNPRDVISPPPAVDTAARLLVPALNGRARRSDIAAEWSVSGREIRSQVSKCESHHEGVIAADLPVHLGSLPAGGGHRCG